jgi:dethiobiotin synthetase
MSLLDPRLAQSLFVAGTDTGVGKTWIATALLRAWVVAGYRAAGMKPVAAGALMTAAGLRNEDALALAAAGNVPLPYALTNPCCLERPTSPHLAAASAGKRIDIVSIRQAFDSISSKTELVIVEGAGGWWAPVGEPAGAGSAGPTMADVAIALGLPVLLVVGLRLGCINHALLTASAIGQAGLPVAGWVANPVDRQFTGTDEYISSLERRLDAPRLTLPV